jgi:iron complex outermembrane receptor protein
MKRHAILTRLMTGTSLSLMLAAAGAAHAQDAVSKADGTEVTAIVVTAPKGQAADVAPVKATLQATEPTALISRKEIEEVAPRVGDYTTTAVLAPAMSSTPNPNGPGSTDGAKLTLRGFTDGNFNVTYDGIAWGDANGPTHHANSFFPSSTIGGVEIERGPGGATELGQANFGGQVNLYSLPFEQKLSFRQTATDASFGTWQSVSTVASGPIKQLHDLNLVVNYMQYATNGYLSNSPSNGQNVFAKATLPVTDKLTLSALYTWNFDHYNQGDSNSVASVAQTTVYGKRFALSNDPTQQTFAGYNYTNKKTDFSYFTEDYDFGDGLKVKNTTYTFAYSNYTYAANDATADNSLTLVTGDGGAALKAADMVTPTPGGAKVYGLPGYLKRNQYRVTGDQLRFDKDFKVGTFTVGGMYEFTNTERSKYDINLLTNAPDYRETQSKNMPVGTTCAAQGLAKLATGSCANPLNVNNNEYSGWHQYQIYTQFEWRPTDAWKITPGFKYVNFNLFVHAPSDATILQPVFLSPTFTAALPFFTANYRITPSWAAYFEYAQGFLVPNVSVFNVANPGNNSIVPQTSTNYQLGTVFTRSKLTIDADVYYIDFKNKLQSQTITDPTSPLFNETIETNSGGAHYSGVEGQGTYVFPYGFSVFGNYAVINAIQVNDKVNPLNDGQQAPGAPRWTGAAGIRSEWHNVGIDQSRLVMNLTDKWTGPQTVNSATATLGPAGTVPTFSDINFSGTYTWRNYSLEGQVLNLANSTGITGAKGKTYLPGTTILALTPTVGGKANLNQFTYDIGTSYQVTLKVAF